MKYKRIEIDTEQLIKCESSWQSVLHPFIALQLEGNILTIKSQNIDIRTGEGGIIPNNSISMPAGMILEGFLRMYEIEFRILHSSQPFK